MNKNIKEHKKIYIYFVISVIFGLLSVMLLYLPFVFANQNFLFLSINIIFSWLLCRIILQIKKIKLCLKHRLFFYILFSSIITFFYVIPTGIKYLSNTVEYYVLVFLSLFIVPTLFSYFIDFCFSSLLVIFNLIKKGFKKWRKLMKLKILVLFLMSNCYIWHICVLKYKLMGKTNVELCSIFALFCVLKIIK